MGEMAIFHQLPVTVSDWASRNCSRQEIRNPPRRTANVRKKAGITTDVQVLAMNSDRVLLVT